MCDALRAESGAHLVLIGSLRIAEAEYVEILGLSANDPTIDVAAYDACPAPCLHVMDQNRIAVHLEDLDRTFPDDGNIQALGSKSYVGFPVTNLKGAVIGVVAFEWDTAITMELSEKVINIMAALLPRIGAEVASDNVQHAFYALINPIEHSPEVTDAAIFRSIVQQAAEIAQVHGAVLTQCVERDANHFRILAATAGGALLTEAEGTLIAYTGTPCDNLKTDKTFFAARELQDIYPDVALFRDLGVQSYCGFGFRDQEQHPIGHVAFLHHRPMSPRMLDSSVVKVIASRAGQELQRVHMEAERQSLRQALTVRKKLQSLGLMAGTIAHDFNNQLAAIIGHTELAMLELDETHEAYPLLDTAQQGMWRARDVIGELVDFAGGSENTATAPIVLNEIILEAIANLRPDLADTIQIVTNMDHNLPAVMGRVAHVHQILSNLCINAIDAMGATGGTLSIETRLTEIIDAERKRCLTGQCARLSSPVVCLEISDDGGGMSPEEAEQVFDPFFSTKGTSRGLGLSGVLGIARRLPAGLTFHTKEGAGTRFRLYFDPVNLKADDPILAIGAKDIREPEGKPQVLIVDDQPEVRQTVARLLASCGYETHQAAGGKEAVELAEKLPDLRAAVVDLIMPEFDGWETLEMLRRVRPGLPAIIVTGHDQNQATRKPDDAPAITMLTKPFSRQSLHKTMKSLLE